MTGILGIHSWITGSNTPQCLSQENVAPQLGTCRKNCITKATASAISNDGSTFRTMGTSAFNQPIVRETSTSLQPSTFGPTANEANFPIPRACCMNNAPNVDAPDH